MGLVRVGVVGAVLLVTTGIVNGEGSGAAILKGLEQAESRQARANEIEAATDAIAEEGTSEDRHVSRSFICRKADLRRQIAIEYPAAEADYACRVVYDSEKGLNTPWHARNERNYCEPRAVGLVKKLREMGWQCAE